MKKIITALVFSAATLSQLSAQPSQPLSLKDCRRLALENNEQVMTANNAVEKAKLDRQIAFAQYLPKVDGSFTMIQLQDQDLLDIGDVLGLQLQTRGTYLAGINVTLPLYVGGQLTAANRLATIGQKVSEEQRRKTRMQIIADVDNAYYTLISVRSKVQMLEAYSRQMQALYDKVNVREFTQAEVFEAEPRGSCFVNANTPEELHALETVLIGE
jgi:outer membrane protein TolC